MAKTELVIRRGGRVELCQLLGVRPDGPNHLLPQEVKEALSRMSSLAQILYLRFGVIDNVSCSLVCTARTLGLHQGEVMPMERLALEELKRFLGQPAEKNAANRVSVLAED